MSKDARFEDVGEAPLRLAAVDVDDLAVISAMAQDAIFPATEMTWDSRHRRFALLLNRFRWEDKAAAEAQGRAYERVRSVLAVEDATHVASQGIDRADPETVLSLLALEWREGGEGTGAVVLTLAGDGAIRVNAECLNVTLSDVTRPYAAPSRKAPKHEV